MFWYGCLSFLFFVLYDLNYMTRNNDRLESLYPAGAILLGLSIAGQLRAGENTLPLAVRILAGLLALAFFALLFWTLFLVAKRGVDKRKDGAPWGERKTVPGGIYALCRHPGVWWLLLGCLCLVPATGFPLQSACVYGALGLLLAWFEDAVAFPRIYVGYDRYKTQTPFLFPNRGSAERCRAGLRRGKGAEPDPKPQNAKTKKTK